MKSMLAVLTMVLVACTPPPPPNIVFIYVDDLGWRDLAFAGSDFYETPHIDGLADAGMYFTRAYANAPNCAPSRAALMTGLYAPRTGVYTVGAAARGDDANRRLIPVDNRTDLDTSFVTLPEQLRDLGYRTAHVGKWHLGGPGSLPTDHGFDVNIGGDAGGSPPGYFYPWVRGQRDIGLQEGGAEGDYLTDRLTDEALEFIRAEQDNPFFLYLSHYAVHTPIQGRPDLVAHFADRAPAGGHFDATYAAMVASVDESTGRVLAELESLGITERTVVVFFADNGGYGPITSMEPLRGSKGMLYEGGIREPLVVVWPGVVRAGSVTDVPVIGTDLLPTLIEIASGGPRRIDGDGVSLVPLLTETAALQTRDLFWHFPAYLEADRSITGVWRTTPASAIQAGDFKLIEYFETGSVELYDLSADAGEQLDLADQRPALADSLHQRLVTWQHNTNAFIPVQPNPAYRQPS